MIVARNASQIGPFDSFKIGVAPQDDDGAALTGFNLDAVNAVAGTPNHYEIGAGTQLRWGRLWISNAHGSQLLPLPVPVTVQFFNVDRVVSNTADNLTRFTAATSPVVSDVQFDDYRAPLSAASLAVANTPVTVDFGGAPPDGVRRFVLAPPGNGNHGSVRIRLIPTNVANPCFAPVVPLTCYLPANEARATFGVYRNQNRFIYTRENY
jgi:hypothetical protein